MTKFRFELGEVVTLSPVPSSTKNNPKALVTGQTSNLDGSVGYHISLDWGMSSNGGINRHIVAEYEIQRQTPRVFTLEQE